VLFLEFLSENLEFKSFLDSENMNLKCITIKSRIIFQLATEDGLSRGARPNLAERTTALLSTLRT
jgi:hypothetical protein